jgi:nitric oxide reductase NorE protein
VISLSRHAELAREREAGYLQGEPGVWVFLVAEMIVFSVLFAVIGFNRIGKTETFAAGQSLLSQPLALINTCVPIIGSALVVLALSAAHHRQNRSAARLLSWAMGCGGAFAIIKITEYTRLFNHGMWIDTDIYWTLFFVITGAHLLHVLVAVTVLGLARKRVVKGLSSRRESELCVSATCYWHMVDILWLILFALFYLVN